MCPHLIFKRKSLPYLLLFFLIFSKTNHAQINFNKNYNILKNIVVDSYLEIASNEKRSITYKKLSSIDIIKANQLSLISPHSLTIATTDSDNDGVADALDLDDDNDGILDDQENIIAPSLTVVAGASGVTIDANNFTVTAALTGGWGAGSIHSNDLNIAPNEDVTISLQTDLSTSRLVMIGLNASGNNSTNSYSDIDYAMYFNNNTVAIYENGSSKGNQSSVSANTDVFSIERVGTTITYLKNGTVFYTSETAANAADYYIDSSLHDRNDNGYTFSNIIVTKSTDLDIDGDGIPNRLDLDSDGDGCPDAIEGAAAFTTADLVTSSMPGGNTGAFYTGEYNSPVVDNLGTSVDSNGIPTLASGGQGIGTAITSQSCTR
jgi:hypothetical protein